MKKDSRKYHRLFFALEFNPAVKSRIQEITAKIDIHQGRWVDPDNYHLTLKFIGEVHHHQIEEIMDAVELPQMEDFNLRFDALDHFPRSQILFLKPERKCALLNELVYSISHSLKGFSFIKPDKRQFKPHVTLARDVETFTAHDLSIDIYQDFTHFSLMESRFFKSGVHYECLEQWPLREKSVKEQLLGEKFFNP